jgi:alanyl-tRNA synthetase
LGHVTIESLQELYGELTNQKDFIINNLIEEKNKFIQTLDKGEKQFYKALEACRREEKNVLDAKTVFTLYDTFGFPPEITAELAIENGITIDSAGFGILYKQHQELSRQGASQKFKGGLADNTVETAALHTATHLLHKALKVVLGEHVKQKGSNITKERLRFDFSHGQKMTPEEINKVEGIVNNVIAQSLQIECREMPFEEALVTGAEGLFKKKYGEIVKVYSMGDFSKEICGGPHADNTRSLGHFKILKEESAASGVRRIKAVLTERK